MIWTKATSELQANFSYAYLLEKQEYLDCQFWSNQFTNKLKLKTSANYYMVMVKKMGAWQFFISFHLKEKFYGWFPGYEKYSRFTPLPYP